MKCNINDLEKLEQLPFKLGRNAYLINEHGSLWNLSKFDYPRTSNKSKCPFYITKLILKTSIGKNIDDVYSRLCKKVKSNYRWIFKDSFAPRYRGYIEYYVDENNNIQEGDYYKKEKDKSFIFYSIDYEEGYINRSTGEILTENEYNGKFWYHYKKKWKKVVTNGFWKEFESKKDKEYIRLQKEKIKQLKLQNKRYKKYQKEKAYSFLTREEIELKKERELDIIKRDSHGFTEESFRYDPYHGKKRKQKEAS